MADGRKTSFFTLLDNHFYTLILVMLDIAFKINDTIYLLDRRTMLNRMQRCCQSQNKLTVS